LSIDVGIASEYRQARLYSSTLHLFADAVSDFLPLN